MGRFFSLKLFLCCLCLSFFLFQGAGLSAAESPKDQLKASVLRGIEKALNLEQKGAVAELVKAVELEPQNPGSYAYLAMVYLFFYETSLEEKEKKNNETSLLRAVENAESRAEKRIEKDPRDGEAYFSMALAKMVRDRWEMDRKNYFRAFREAQDVWDYLEKTRKWDPENYDVYYPMGVIHYYLGQLSGPARWIATLFITPVDREKGLKELELAAEKGYFLKDMARSNLISIYYAYEKQPARALPLARRLTEKYPDNYNFNFAQADILSRLGRFEEAMTVARRIEAGIKSGIPPFRPELWPRYQQLLGKIYLDQGDYEKATEYLKLVLKEQAPYNSRVRAWALVRLGMIADARKERRQAEEYYQRALEVEGAEGSAQRTAREYLTNPYSPPTNQEKKP